MNIVGTSHFGYRWVLQLVGTKQGTGEWNEAADRNGHASSSRNEISFWTYSTDSCNVPGLYEDITISQQYHLSFTCHDCDTHVGVVLSSYSSYDRQMTLYNMAYHWLPLCLSQEKWIVGFWNMQVQQMCWRKLLTALIAIVTMGWIVMQLILQQWVKLQHTPHHVTWKLVNTVDKNNQSIHFIPTQTHIHQFSWIGLHVGLLIVQFTERTVYCYHKLFHNYSTSWMFIWQSILN